MKRLPRLGLVVCLLFVIPSMAGCGIGEKAQELVAALISKFNDSKDEVTRIKTSLAKLGPSEVLEQFYLSWDKVDLNGMLACTKKGSRVHWAFVRQVTVSRDSNRIKVQRVEQTGNTATVFYEKLDLSPSRDQVYMSWPMKATLARSGNSWEITDVGSDQK